MTACLEKLSSIEKRIAEYQNLVAQPLPSSVASQPPQNAVQGLPRISAPPKEADILRNPGRPKNYIEANVGTLVKSLDSPDQAQKQTLTKTLSPHVHKVLNSGRGFLTQQQQEAISITGVKSTFTWYWVQALRTPYLWMFRCTFSRRFCAVVFGTPYSDLDMIIDSIKSLTNLVVHSIEEDSFGCVSKDIPLIIRTYVSIINSLDAFSASLGIHWTDVYYDESGTGRRQEEINTIWNALRKNCSKLLESLGITIWRYTEVPPRTGRTGKTVEEADLVIAQLKTSLREMMTSFGRFAEDVGLKASEIRAVRRITGMDQ